MEPPSQIYVYVDETRFSLPGGAQMLGAGALAVTTPITPDLIARALASLQTDPDRRPASPRFRQDNAKRDGATLERGYFHASSDSMNSHSALARECQASVHGDFKCSFALVKTRTEERDFRTHSMNAIMPALRTRTPMVVTFEERTGFGSLAAQDLVEQMHRGLDFCAYDMTLLRSFYPRISVFTEGKMHPGLQVVDLLLWAATQAKFRASSTKARIAEWCGLRCWADAMVEGLSLQSLRYHVGGGDRALLRDDTNYIDPYPVNYDSIEEGMDESNLVHLYLLGEEAVRRYCTEPLPAHAEHLRTGLRKAMRGLQDLDLIGPGEVQAVARQFLRLFDTVPLYSDFNKDDARWMPLVRTKRLLALALRDDLLNGGMTLDFLVRARRSGPRPEG